MKRALGLVLAAAAVAWGWPASAHAQLGLFGPNKIQYRPFDWRTLRGEHIDLYYYPEEEEIARVALRSAEDAYRELEVRFRNTVETRVPLVVYASHYDFEQTNLLPFTPPEGLLGFTEYGRSRVALPFRGSYAEFRHTIKHEMVHVFQLARGRLNGRLYPRLRGMGFPLWFSEGSAEYFSEGQDTQDQMLVRDLTQGGNLPTIDQLNYAGGGAVYAIGGDLIRFLAERYGEWRLVQAYDDSWKYENFDDMLVGVFGKSAATLTAEWHYSLRRRFYPLVESQRPLSLTGHELAPLSLKPVVWTPPGDSEPEVLYISPRSGYTNVLARPLHGGHERTVVKGERTPQLESFHVFDSRMDISPEGVLVFSSRYMENDALIFWDVTRDRLVGRYQFRDVVSILSPSWAPDHHSIVFSGLRVSGESDLYRLWLPDGRLERLTNDRYQDTDPSFSPDGSRVVFSSDRTPYGVDGASNLFVLDLATRAVRYLTYGDWHDQGPRWADTNHITFTSDRRGVQDIYTVDSTGLGQRESGVPGGIYDPVWVPSAGVYVAGGFEGLSFNLYALHPQVPDSGAIDSLRPPVDTLFALQPAEGDIELDPDTEPAAEWYVHELDDARFEHSEPGRYEKRYSLDFAGAEAAITPGAGAVQGATFLVSDMLQDNLFLVNILAFQQGGGLSSLVSNINGAVTYLNQARRLNWGIGVFRLRGTFYENTLDQTYRETSTGGFGLIRYPLSRFTRVEARLQLEYADRTDYFFGNTATPTFPTRHGVVTSNFLSYVHDNSLWVETGPIDGGRERLTGGIVTDLANARFDSWIISADVRRYLRTSLHTTLALRGFVYVTGGERPQRITLGGSYGLRGYPRYTYVSGTQAWMVNAEWRFPLTDYLSFGFPFGEWRFPGVQGAVFADIGGTSQPNTPLGGAIGAYGFSFRMNIGFPLVLRLDLGWRYGNLDRYLLPANYRRNHFVAFWFGFNY